MTQTLAAGANPSAPAGARRAQRVRFPVRAPAAAAVLVLLVLLDTISPPGPPLSTLIGGVAYGAKTLVGVFIVVFGLWALVTTRLPFLFRLAVSAYLFVVLAWSVLWLVGDTQGDAQTYLLNPGFSVWSWLMVLLVPLAARWNRDGALIDAIGRIPLLLGLAMMLVPAAGMAALGWNLNASNAGVAMLFLLACRRPGRMGGRFTRAALALVVAAAMFAAGYRIYALAALAYAGNQFVPRMTRGVLVAELVLFTFIPVIYQYAITNYGDVLISNTNQDFYDTRSFLFKELVDDFSVLELWVGRGLDAKYYSPYFFNIAKNYGQSVGYSNIWRPASEIAWLNVILHLGIIGLVPFYLALIAPAFARVRTAAVASDGLRRFIPTMMLLFAGELWNSVSASYFCWYMALGALLSVAPVATARRSGTGAGKVASPKSSG